MNQNTLCFIVLAIVFTGCLSTNQNQDFSVTSELLEADAESSRAMDIRDYSLYAPRHHNKSLNDYAKQMVMDFQFSPAFNQAIAVSSFVEFDDSLIKTNMLGNQLAEAFLIEMNQAGYAVADINASGAINVNTQGGFVFSRKQQSQFNNLCCALSGNLIYQSNGVRVNSKLFDIDTKRVIAASTLVIPYFVIEHLGQTQLRAN
ncbi:FlgO family outer membrane protein [uncultured Paraglaciecola sp.]|uniref:FlgO family outer membrane protein n=1 Tax=uncultured Paraglaciecola sp. TaxID=1765024 RepID=UPI00260878F6|nr:FlgO family outer membrane protein [uncultured Paraglaciecola sp.]